MFLYSFLLYKALVYLYHFNTLFSNKKLIYTNVAFIGKLNDVVFLLNNYFSKPLSVLFIFLLALLAIIGVCKRSNYISNFLLWLVILNLNSYLYATLTAGDYLLNQLLFFNIFFSFKNSSGHFFNDLKTAFHNMALLGIKIQICLVYALASWFKLTDADWLNGSALYHIFQIPEYTNSILMSLPIWICLILTYLTVIYQLLFPVFVWFRRFKIYILTFGIAQHLIIAFAMGLFSFGIIMIICYILFLKYDYHIRVQHVEKI